MTAPRRQVYDFVWDRRTGCWVLKKMGVVGRKGDVRRFPGMTKTRALTRARGVCRSIHADGPNVQLRVHLMDGTFAFENTYGDDPRRRVG